MGTKSFSIGSVFGKLSGARLVAVVIGLALLVLLVWAVLAIPALIQPLLVALVVVAVGWLAIHFGLAAWRGRKQSAFDDAVTAKEGIDDRKREWASWTQELRKQGIDRYELPFYLLVGEPQSGKSVLLQNSDLHFPFGQTRLSGVGGTRGCDWWFTEEAVILDLAGRLFTHEGGAADQAEWEAFLDLLYEFRPLCPANGVLLVVPCDGLMRDTPEECAAKANKIQSALLTLTKKLQAQLPIYLVMTKGDQVFGFAECTHRLDATKRHEMFGWSRPADRLEAPFDLAEVRQGFDSLAERARLLCSEMLVSARIPEALGEVDRMIVFPDELEGTWTNLEAYLKRIFTESGLVDRFYFRGLYLTSGLQTGVPVARLCNQLLGGAGAADQQDLERLFGKQRAFFIKDLIRKRVFSERGLVRPTAGRVLRARRNALVGYGASALIALAAVVGSIVHLASGEGDEAEVLEQALTSVEALRAGLGTRQAYDLRGALGVLEKVEDAVRAERSTMEETFDSTRDSFEDLFVSTFDAAVVGRMREAAVRQVLTDLEREPVSYDAFARQSEQVALLLGPIDLGERDHVDALLATIPASQRRAAAGGALADSTFDLRTAVRRRVDYGDDAVFPPRPESAPLLLDLARRTLARWDGTLTPGTPWQVRNELGYVVAWMGVEDAYGAFRSEDLAAEPDLLAHCRTYARSTALLDEIHPTLDAVNERLAEITRLSVSNQLAGVSAAREPVAAFVARHGGAASDAPDGWAARTRIERFAGRAFAGGAQDTTIGMSTGNNEVLREGIGALSYRVSDARALVEVPTPQLTRARSGELASVSGLVPPPDWRPRDLPGVLRAALEREVIELGATGRVRRAEALPPRLFLAAAAVTGREFRERYESWSRLPGATDARRLDAERVGLLADLRAELLPFAEAVAGADAWIDALESLLLEHLEAVAGAWDESGVPAGELDWEVYAALQRAQIEGAGAGPSVPALARRLASRYLDRYHAERLEAWSEFPEDPDGTTALLEAVARHFSELHDHVPARETLERDDAYLTWRSNADALVESRLLLLEEGLRAAWSVPPHELQGSLASAALTVDGLRSRRSFAARIDEAREAGAPALDQSVYDPEAPLFRDLLDAGDVARRLQTLRSPNPSRFERLDFVTSRLDRLVAPLLNLQGAVGPPVAALLFRLQEGPPRAVPEDAGLLYAHNLYDALHHRAILDLRAAYVRDLADAMRSDYPGVMQTLYAADLEEAEELARRDRDTAEQLASLFDRRGRLDRLHADYHLGDGLAAADGAGGAAEVLRGLRPTAAELELDRDRPWWEFDAFLSAFQRFLLGTDADDLRQAKLRVGLRPESGAEIWDIRSGRRKGYFYYPLTERGDWKGVPVSEDMAETTLVWGLRPGPEKALRMRWSDSYDAERGWGTGDARFELSGTLAPVLLTWIRGERRSDGWTVELEPAHSQWLAPFRVRFVGADLPPRPEEPRWR